MTLDHNVDNDEGVMSEWSGLQDIPEERYSVTGATGTGSVYMDSLTISPLSDQDDGTYTCIVTVTGENNVQQTTASYNITVTGENIVAIIHFNTVCVCITHTPALPTPEIMISPGDSTVTAGDSHTVQCTVTDIPYLAVSPTVELIGPGDSVLATDMSFTLTHTLDPVMTSHAGQYTCRASVIIASVSVNVSSQSITTLTVQSKFIFSKIDKKVELKFSISSSSQSIHHCQ